MPQDEHRVESQLDKALSQIGLSSEFAQRVRFRGPVGKLALIAVLCVICVAAVGVKSDNSTVQAMCVGLAVLVAIFCASGILWFSHKHPEQATPEGDEFGSLEVVENAGGRAPAPNI